MIRRPAAFVFCPAALAIPAALITPSLAAPTLAAPSLATPTLAASETTPQPKTPPTKADTRPEQVVIISFDGAHDNKLWQRSRDLGQETGAHFTYFLSCVFYLERAERNTYQPPRMKAGRSNVGFAQNRQEIATRLDQVWKAHLEGHEIASHGCGHFDGKNWSTKDWAQEIEAFRTIVANAWQANKIDGEPQGWKDLILNKITGFRAPYLSDDKPVQAALREHGFAYQASGVTSGPELPKNLAGLKSFGLPLIPEGPAQKPVIAMDYNLYVRHSGGKEKPERAAEFEQRSYNAFMAAFNKQYNGSRIPLQMGFHFVLMNNGAYWNALERFARNVCGREDVRCISYQEYLSQPEQNKKQAAL